MARGNGGAIINIASQLGHLPSGARIAYGTSKAGLLFMTRLMARDHAAQKVRINSISPGPVLTGRLIGRNGSVNEVTEWFAPLTALGRIGKPGEIAAAAVFLASDESAFTTGADFLIDGGYSVKGKS
jgi:NAD(P)-dependent dehydrogenase (short-subunit alcohol dehydrogenase family)